MDHKGKDTKEGDTNKQTQETDALLASLLEEERSKEAGNA
jgi:hypothetical protein